MLLSLGAPIPTYRIDTDHGDGATDTSELGLTVWGYAYDAPITDSPSASLCPRVRRLKDVKRGHAALVQKSRLVIT